MIVPTLAEIVITYWFRAALAGFTEESVDAGETVRMVFSPTEAQPGQDRVTVGTLQTALVPRPVSSPHSELPVSHGLAALPAQGRPRTLSTEQTFSLTSLQSHLTDNTRERLLLLMILLTP